MLKLTLILLLGCMQFSFSTGLPLNDDVMPKVSIPPKLKMNNDAEQDQLRYPPGKSTRAFFISTTVEPHPPKGTIVKITMIILILACGIGLFGIGMCGYHLNKFVKRCKERAKSYDEFLAYRPRRVFPAPDDPNVLASEIASASHYALDDLPTSDELSAARQAASKAVKASSSANKKATLHLQRLKLKISIAEVARSCENAPLEVHEAVYKDIVADEKLAACYAAEALSLAENTAVALAKSRRQTSDEPHSSQTAGIEGYWADFAEDMSTVSTKGFAVADVASKRADEAKVGFDEKKRQISSGSPSRNVSPLQGSGTSGPSGHYPSGHDRSGHDASGQGLSGATSFTER